MPLFRKLPVTVEAHQWFKNGDHPLDYSRVSVDGSEPSPAERKARGWEGDIVRYFRHPNIEGSAVCTKCGKTMHTHGWIDTLEGGHVVCPGDWIITGVEGERYPCKPDIFQQTYEEVK